MCIFARQDLTRDPPFSRLDLISCLNVLIYLGPVLQKRVIPIFHYALKPTGFLLLGKSEAVGSFSDMFMALDRRHRIYAKKATPSLLRTDFVPIDLATAGGAAALPAASTARDDLEVQHEADRIVLAKYAPAGVLVNENLDIVHFRGRTGAYLEPGSGQPSLNPMRMARQGLSLELRTAIQKARRKGEPVRKEGIRLDSSGRNRIVSIEVIPLKVRTGGGRYHIVNFEETASAPERKAAVIRPAKLRAPDREIDRLKKELEATKEYLQSIIEEQNATNEELKSANEEILSSNEELSSTNEELETAKEELQATNEELTTVNEELQNRNLELSQLNNDLNNVLASVNIPIVFLGPDLRVRRCTPMAEKALNLIPSDIGRRITDIKPNIHLPDLEKMVLDVIETASLRERQVQDSEGHWFSLQIRPYRMADSKIDGAVLALMDIDEVKRSLQQLQESRDYAQAIVETVREGLLVLDEHLRVKRANRFFYEMFLVSPAETEGRLIHQLGDGQWNIPNLIDQLKDVAAGNARLDGLEVDADFPA